MIFGKILVAAFAEIFSGLCSFSHEFSSYKEFFVLLS